MRCEEVMKQRVRFVREHDTAQAAARRMREADIGFLPVCDSQGKVTGAVSDRDLAVRVCAENLPSGSTQVGKVMTREVVSCLPTDTLSHAEMLMREHHKSRVMVIDEEGGLRGVLSLSDIVQYEKPSRAAKALLGVTSRKYRPESP